MGLTNVDLLKMYYSNHTCLQAQGLIFLPPILFDVSSAFNHTKLLSQFANYASNEKSFSSGNKDEALKGVLSSGFPARYKNVPPLSSLPLQLSRPRQLSPQIRRILNRLHLHLPELNIGRRPEL